MNDSLFENQYLKNVCGIQEKCIQGVIDKEECKQQLEIERLKYIQYLTERNRLLQVSILNEKASQKLLKELSFAMGQHKHNPMAIAAKNGELPPRPKKIGKREWERKIVREIEGLTGMDWFRQMIKEVKQYE